jgi:pSer/pThr/pTyr-binding forkhead associated (FHA) protein
MADEKEPEKRRPAGRLFLRVMHGPDEGKGWRLREGQTYVLGRSHTCAFRVTDPTASGAHAKLSSDHGIWFIADLDSSHGTRVNNHRILHRKPLFDRDRIRLGNTVLEFRQYEALDPEDLEDIDRGVKLVE